MVRVQFMFSNINIFIVLKNYWPTMVCVAVVLYATLTADPMDGAELPLIPNIDKVIHAVMFGGLAGAAAFDWQRSHRGRNVGGRVMAVICALCAVFGCLDEIAQATLTEARSGDVLDFVADIAGIAVAFFAAPPAVRCVLGIKHDRLTDKVKNGK